MKARNFIILIDITSISDPIKFLWQRYNFNCFLIINNFYIWKENFYKNKKIMKQKNHEKKKRMQNILKRAQCKKILSHKLIEKFITNIIYIWKIQ